MVTFDMNTDSAMCRMETIPVMQASGDYEQHSRPTSDVHSSEIAMKGLWKFDWWIIKSAWQTILNIK